MLSFSMHTLCSLENGEYLAETTQDIDKISALFSINIATFYGLLNTCCSGYNNLERVKCRLTNTVCKKYSEDLEQ